MLICSCFDAGRSFDFIPITIRVTISRNLGYICLIIATRAMVRFATNCCTSGSDIFRPFGRVIMAECRLHRLLATLADNRIRTSGIDIICRYIYSGINFGLCAGFNLKPSGIRSTRLATIFSVFDINNITGFQGECHRFLGNGSRNCILGC